MAFNATEFRAQLKHGGARPNLFKVTLNFPVNGEADETFSFMCKSSQLPGMTVGQAVVHYFGRAVKLSGDRTFDDWSVQVINDEDFKVRNAFEAWQNRLNLIDHDTGAIQNTAGADWTSLYIKINVQQYAKQGGEPIKSYTLNNAWPTSIGPIELSWESNDQVEEFSVNFSYDFFTTDLIEGE